MKSRGGSGVQLSGGEIARRPGDRLFFAVHPDARTAQRICMFAQAVRTKHGLRGNPLPPERLHVTLHHLGDHAGLPPSLLAAAQEAAAQISTQAFEVRLDCVASFSGRARKRPCVLRNVAADANSGLCALQGALGRHLHAAGLGRYVERRFTPHVTLLYDEREISYEIVQPIAWTVRSFALVHSLLGRGEHRVLAAWELKA